MTKRCMILIVAFSVALTVFTMNAQTTINGVKLYKPGFFPPGSYCKVKGLNKYSVGDIKGVVYLTDPVKFINEGKSDGKGGFTYFAKIDHTFVGGFIKSVIDESVTNALFIITIPYNNPLHKGDAYRFTNANPLTVVSKKTSMDNNGQTFAIYTCAYNGYLKVREKNYPAK